MLLLLSLMSYIFSSFTHHFSCLISPSSLFTGFLFFLFSCSAVCPSSILICLFLPSPHPSPSVSCSFSSSQVSFPWQKTGQHSECNHKVFSLSLSLSLCTPSASLIFHVLRSFCFLFSISLALSFPLSLYSAFPMHSSPLTRKTLTHTRGCELIQYSRNPLSHLSP